MEAIQKFLEEDRGISSWVNLGISIAIAVLIVFVLLKLERKVSRKWIFKHDDINTRYTEKIIRFLIIFIAALFVIMTSSVTKDFGNSLFQGTAVIAAIAGFAAKPVLSDMFCGFMISTTKPFNIGDRIELDDGTAGIVKDITIRHVVLQGIDTLKIVIPNSAINERRITNLSYMTKTRSIHFRQHGSGETDYSGSNSGLPVYCAQGRRRLFSRLFPCLSGQRAADGDHGIL